MTNLKSSPQKVRIFDLLEEVLDPDFSTFFLGWNGKTDEDDVNVWEDNWDDDAIEDDFSVQLM